MSTSNKRILEKADMALADLTAGGLLLPAQAKKFIKLLIKESRLMKLAYVKPMKSHKEQLPKIRFGSRVLRAGSSGVALPLAERSKPDLDEVELDAKLFKAETRIPEEVLEDSIEKGQLKQTIMTQLGEAVARDIDEVAIQGDIASADTFLAQLDGVLKQATSNIVAAGGVSLTKTILRDMLKAMPSEYLRDKKKMAFLTSVDAESDWRDSMSDRGTALGDKFLTEDGDGKYRSIPVRPIPLFPENLAPGNRTNVILTDPKNIIFGFWRQVKVKTDEDISAGVVRIVTTMRFDVKFEHEPAVVKAEDVAVS